jgi:hypothetical protein
MKSVLIDLFTSKKFLAALTAIAVYIAGRFGFDLDTTVLDRIYAALLVYIGAQGIADHGKGAAEVAAAAAATRSSAPAAAGAATSQTAGGIAAVSLVVLAVMGFSVTSACGPRSTQFAHDLWDCTAPERVKAVAAVTPLVTSLILAAASADGKLIDTATVKAAVSKANLTDEAGILVSCAVASAFAALAKPAALAAGAPQSAALVLDPSALRTALDEIRAERFPGATFKTASGEI